MKRYVEVKPLAEITDNTILEFAIAVLNELFILMKQMS